jgi:hypothetical protein
MDMATDTEWVTIEPTGLTPKQRRAWQSYQEATKAAKEQREALETILQEGLPKGKSLLVNLRFGKLQVALVTASARTTKVDTKARSLADYLEQAE